MQARLVLLVFALGLSAGCTRDCPTRCDRSYSECLDDPSTETVQCDIGYDQCLANCGALGTASAPDGG